VTREYLNAAQLAAVTPWSRKAIDHLVANGLLIRGVHYFQPQGPRHALIFKWSAIVEFIEGRAAESMRADAPGGRDVEATAAALERLLVREPCGPPPAALPHRGVPGTSRARDRAS
jgi:hypothetical protein